MFGDRETGKSKADAICLVGLTHCLVMVFSLMSFLGSQFLDNSAVVSGDFSDGDFTAASGRSEF